jgi:hypothetical protein
VRDWTCEIAIESDCSQLLFMGIAYDKIHARETGDFGWSPLGIAASDNDSGVGILPAHAADGGTSVLIGAAGHRARVQDDYRSLLGTGCTGKTELFELTFKGGPISLRGAASKVLYKEFGHTLWYRTPESL